MEASFSTTRKDDSYGTSHRTRSTQGRAAPPPHDLLQQTARISAADALKKASWILAAANAYLGFAKGSLAYMVIVVIGWLVAQTLAVILLSIEEKEGSQGPEEQQHASTSGIRGKRPQHRP
ncbi:hypothetical protein [uncultured Methylibium sp.]|uniref:hypothetical protein n=1 Tax=uncultured Methylibium sp. TaxID=381093 RepID=UPI0025E6B887|nr:hypothetical protein [uncultured Methylibium sp.]